MHRFILFWLGEKEALKAPSTPASKQVNQSGKILQLKVGVRWNATTQQTLHNTPNLLSLLQERCAQTLDDVRSHTPIYTYRSPPLWSSVSACCAFLEGSLHLFSRCGDRSCWQSLVAAFTRDPLGRAWNTAAALIASRCAVLCADFHLSTNALTSVNTAEGTVNTGHLEVNISRLRFRNFLDGDGLPLSPTLWSGPSNMAVLQHVNLAPGVHNYADSGK